MFINTIFPTNILLIKYINNGERIPREFHPMFKSNEIQK